MPARPVKVSLPAALLGLHTPPCCWTPSWRLWWQLACVVHTSQFLAWVSLLGAASVSQLLKALCSRGADGACGRGASPAAGRMSQFRRLASGQRSARRWESTDSARRIVDRRAALRCRSRMIESARPTLDESARIRFRPGRTIISVTRPVEVASSSACRPEC